MNVPDLRNADFDSYRQRALELREQAMKESIARAVAVLKALLGAHTAAPATRGAPRSSQCPA